MARKRGIGNIVPDITNQLDRDFNAFIQLALEGLARKNNSPVYTGFFASSWKASTQRTKPTDRVQDFAPWSDLKKRRDKGDLSAFRIQPRFKVPEFNYRTKVFIGNAAQYAAYALENPKVANFVQGELRSLIQPVLAKNAARKCWLGRAKELVASASSAAASMFPTRGCKS